MGSLHPFQTSLLALPLPPRSASKANLFFCLDPVQPPPPCRVRPPGASEEPSTAHPPGKEWCPSGNGPQWGRPGCTPSAHSDPRERRGHTYRRDQTKGKPSRSAPPDPANLSIRFPASVSPGVKGGSAGRGPSPSPRLDRGARSPPLQRCAPARTVPRCKAHACARSAGTPCARASTRPGCRGRGRRCSRCGARGSGDGGRGAGRAASPACSTAATARRVAPRRPWPGPAPALLRATCRRHLLRAARRLPSARPMGGGRHSGAERRGAPRVSRPGPRRRAAQICTLLLAPASARFLHLAAAAAAPPLRGPCTGRRAGGRRSLGSGRPGGRPAAPPPPPALPQSPVNVGSGVPELSRDAARPAGLAPCVQRKGSRGAGKECGRAQRPVSSTSNCNSNHGDHL